MHTASHVQTLLKAISWRIVGTLSTTGMVYALTQSTRVALSIGGTEAMGKILLYYVHERVWQRLTLTPALRQRQRRPSQQGDLA